MEPNDSVRPDYGFIMDEPKKTGGLLGPNKKTRILIAIAGAGLLIVVFAFISSLLFGGSTNTDRLVEIAQIQTELVRVADIGIKEAKSADAKNFAINTKTSLTTSLNESKSLIKKQGYELKSGELSLKKNSKIGPALEEAAGINSFDQVFTDYIKSELAKYQLKLKTAFDASSSKSEKKLLEDAHNQAELLINNK